MSAENPVSFVSADIRPLLVGSPVGGPSLLHLVSAVGAKAALLEANQRRRRLRIGRSDLAAIAVIAPLIARMIAGKGNGAEGCREHQGEGGNLQQ